jgi:hypothetical protein
MSKYLKISPIILAAFMCGQLNAQQQLPDSLGLPGDNLNLYAVMDLFQKSETLEGFEKALNDKNNTINNLDLDNDGRVDYITVTDYPDGDLHNIVLRDPINDREQQDVAVFTVSRDKDGRIEIQVTGDEDLYGKDYIIEPAPPMPAGETPNPGYMGNANVAESQTVVTQSAPVVAVSSWPVVLFIYRPAYVIWRSPWYFGYYPPYWRPWRPHYWHYYYGYHYHYFYPARYTVVHVHRYPGYNTYYHSSRVESVTVHSRITNRNYVKTYSRPDSKRDGERRSQSVNRGNSIGNTNQGSGRINTNSNRRTTTSSGVQTQSTTTRKSETTVTGRNGAEKTTVRSTKKETKTGTSGNTGTARTGNQSRKNGSATLKSEKKNRKASESSRKHKEEK